MIKILSKLLATSMLILLVCVPGAWSSAEVFSDYSLGEAKEVALKEKKLLLLDFTASWCPPCKMMEKSTWTDDALQAWIKENAIAVQFDVDKSKEVASSLNIRAMPTLILFTPESGSSEFDRKVGYMDAEAVLSWLQGARSGKSVKELEQSSGGVADYFKRFSEARQLQATKKYAEAVDQYLALWKDLGDKPGQASLLKRAVLPGQLKAIVKVYPESKTKISTVRDAAKSSEKWRDWLILNTVLGDNTKTLSWFDQIKKDPDKKELIKKNGSVLVAVLFSEKRWADTADYLYPDPIATVNEYYKKAEAVKKPRPNTEVSKSFDPFPTMVMLLYGTYVGAGRDDQAKKIEEECLRLNDTPAMRKVLSSMSDSMKKARAKKAKATK